MKFKLFLLLINLFVYSGFLLLFKFLFIVNNPDSPQRIVSWTEAGGLAFVAWACILGVFGIVGGLRCLPDVIEKAWR